MMINGVLISSVGLLKFIGVTLVSKFTFELQLRKLPVQFHLCWASARGFMVTSLVDVSFFFKIA